MDPAAAVTLDGLPLEVLDAIVRCLGMEDGSSGGGRRSGKRLPPRGLGCLAAVSRRLRLCCIDRADGIWQKHEQAAFGAWPQHGETANNTTAHARYSAHMSIRVRLRLAVWARTKPGGLCPIPIRLPVNSGCSDRVIQSHCRRISAVLMPNAPDSWLISQLPLELIELWRAIDGQPLSTTLRPEQLVIPGFRLMSLGEVAAELSGEPVADETPSFAAGGGGGLGGDWLSALTADPYAPFVELPITAPQGIQRYTVRFSRSDDTQHLQAAGGLKVSAAVRLRGMIGDGQEKAESLVDFFRQL